MQYACAGLCVAKVALILGIIIVVIAYVLTKVNVPKKEESQQQQQEAKKE